MTKPKAKKKTVKRIILSRTDSIGDVILSLPMTGVLKKLNPEASKAFVQHYLGTEISDL